jgi:aspartokinase-like uncharacterized kinase
MKRRVVKLGGSLLNIDQLDVKLIAWLAVNDDMQNIIVVGGGKKVDGVRELHAAKILSDEDAHKIACATMRINALLVASKITGTTCYDDIQQLDVAASSTVTFDSFTWIMQQENVPASWDFTSDSIAARLASELDADELVLIKSRMGSIDEPGFVDECFATESKSVKSIRVCTLNE